MAKNTEARIEAIEERIKQKIKDEVIKERLEHEQRGETLRKLLDCGHWHHYVAIEIMVPATLTKAKAWKLSREKVIELAEQSLGGFLADWKTSESGCWWKRPSEHCRSHHFYENRKRAELMKKKIKGPTQ